METTSRTLRVEHAPIEHTATDTIEPGQSQEFLARPQDDFRPDELLLIGHHALRLDSVRIGDRVTSFCVQSERTAPTGIPTVSLRAMPDRGLTVAMDIFVTLTNTGASPVRVRPVLHGIGPSCPGARPSPRDSSSPAFLPMQPVTRGPVQREFRIPSNQWLDAHPAGRDGATKDSLLSPGVCIDHHGNISVEWRAPSAGRITRLRIDCNSDAMSLFDLKIGNYSVFLSDRGLPAELFRHGIRVRYDVPGAHLVRFFLGHNTKDVDFVNVQIELDFQDASPVDSTTSSRP